MEALLAEEMSRPRILIATDSRGSGLEQYLKEHHNYWSTLDTRVIVIKGAKLENLISLLEGRPRGWETAVICWGICNLTERTVVDGIKVLQCNSDQDNITYLRTQIHEIKHLYGSRVNFATLPPALLTNYLNFHNSEIPQERRDNIV